MNRDSPTLDDLYGIGAEAADDFAGTMDEIWGRIEKVLPESPNFGAEDEYELGRKIFEAEMTKLWDSYRDMCRRHEHTVDSLTAAEQRVEGARELLEMLKRAAINMRGEDFNLSSAEWALVHAWLSPAKGDV
jgi:hypothetical protein